MALLLSCYVQSNVTVWTVQKQFLTLSGTIWTAMALQEIVRGAEGSMKAAPTAGFFLCKGVNRTRWIPSGFLYLSQALDNLARVE
jgi:hypothetical protein